MDTTNSHQRQLTLEMIAHRVRKLGLLVLDCDGVLTDGRLYLAGTDEPTITMHVRDGLGIKMLHRAGVATAVITGRYNAALATRAKVLGMLEVVHNRLDKGPAMVDLLERHGYDRDQVGFMGDDLADLAGFARAAVAFCPADAIEEVRAAADYVTLASGGMGAVREVAEIILKAQDKWEEMTSILADIH